MSMVSAWFELGSVLFAFSWFGLDQAGTRIQARSLATPRAGEFDFTSTRTEHGISLASVPRRGGQEQAAGRGADRRRLFDFGGRRSFFTTSGPPGSSRQEQRRWSRAWQAGKRAGQHRRPEERRKEQR